MRIKRLFVILLLIFSITYFFSKNDIFEKNEAIMENDVNLYPNESNSNGKDNDAEISKPENSICDNNLPPFPSEVKIEKPEVSSSPASPEILPTTIEGGLVMRNDTSFDININKILETTEKIILPKDGVHVLIVHTHGSEAYASSENKEYKPSDSYRTENKDFSIIRVGDELTSCLESYGLTVLHDRNIYDYPSYQGSYVRSGESVQKYIAEYPEIKIVFDIHRDAIGNKDIIYKTYAEDSGKPSSQVMLLVGTGENGLYHPNWKQNLRFAYDLQKSVVEKFPTLARPLALKKERYNQQLAPGSILIEVGSSGNTLEEALTAIRLFADAAAPVLLSLTEK